jgi:hypothetical protein
MTFLICRPTDIPCLTFASRRFGNLPCEYKKPHIFPKTFTKLHQPQIYVYWGKKQHLENQHGRFSENKVLYGWPVLQSETLIGFSTVLHVTKIKKEYFVHSVCNPSKGTPHTCQQCFLHFIPFSNGDILPYGSFLATEWATGFDGFTFILCNKRLSSLGSMQHSSESCANPISFIELFTSLQKQRESYIL